MTKRNIRILSLSAVALLAAVILVILVRRRGRKVYLKDRFRLNNAYYINIHPEGAWDDFIYYNGTLDYVVVPYKAKTIESDGDQYVQVSAIGYLGPDGKIKRIKLKGSNFISISYLDI